MYRHMLVPLDGSPLGSTTIDQAIAYARGSGARLTVFHARPDLAATGEGALLVALSAEQRALAMIRDEHRSLGAVLHALLAQIEQPQPAPALVKAMLHYVEQFPEQLHHPKEDAYLFQALRTRTAECNDLLDDLE